MKGFVVQNWLTIRRAPQAAPPTVVQSQPFWLDLSDYRDVIAWLDVSEVTVEAGVTAQLLYETAPFEDELLFSTLAGPITVVPGVAVTKMIADIAPPLAKYFRWKLTVSGATTVAWDVTFRILIAVNRPGYRTPTYGGLPMSGKGSTIALNPSLVSQSATSRDSTWIPVNIPKKKL